MGCVHYTYFLYEFLSSLLTLWYVAANFYRLAHARICQEVVRMVQEVVVAAYSDILK